MDNINQLSPIETVVAYFFAVSAVVTILLTSWAYIYQKRRELKAGVSNRPEGYGEYFIRR